MDRKQAGRRLAIVGDGPRAEALREAVAAEAAGVEGMVVAVPAGAPGERPLAVFDALRGLPGAADAVILADPEAPDLAALLQAEIGCPVIALAPGSGAEAARGAVRHALEAAGRGTPQRKIGIVGGVGPAATVDFFDKIVRNTPAARDQDHLKVVVEQNPQIPDRTAHLLADGPDPTLALYAACKRLEADGASLIAIPCNTAHVFVDRLQPRLAIPIVSMIGETVAAIRQRFPDVRTVGLLATTGTIRSRVYHAQAEAAGLELMTPDEAHQALVMSAIYGERGVKAGYTEGECKQALVSALAHLVERGARVVVLGCTELPLLLAESDAHAVAGRTVALLDPTAILARRCVALCRPAAP